MPGWHSGVSLEETRAIGVAIPEVYAMKSLLGYEEPQAYSNLWEL
jgi:hypothetical protein